MSTKHILVGGAALLMTYGLAQAATVSRSDREFLNSVATMDMTGAHEAQMAENKATRAEVKDFAVMFDKDESESFGHLLEVAGKTGVSVPRGIDARRIATIQGLTALNGDKFDRQFARDEVAAVQRALAAFQREARYGQNADVKAYANRMIPVLTNDLKRAHEVAGTAASTAPHTK